MILVAVLLQGSLVGWLAANTDSAPARAAVAHSPDAPAAPPADAPSQSPVKVTTVQGGSAVENPSIAPTKGIEVSSIPPITTRELLNKPKNLARWHMGAVLFSAHAGPLQPFNWRDADNGESAGLLLGDDPSASLELTPDVYKYVIELNDFYLVDRFTFKNFNAVGSLQVFAANSLVRADSKEWKPLTEPIKFDQEGYVSARFDEVDTRHLMVIFDIVQTGSIGIFGVYGDMSLAETRIPRTREDAEQVEMMETDPQNMTKFNFGSLHGGSRVTHVSQGDVEGVQNLIDDDVESFYQFPEDSEEDVMIVDMTEQHEVNRVAMLFESGPGVFDFYMTNDLPEDMEVIEETEGVVPGEADADAGEMPDSEDMASLWEQELRSARPMLLAARPGTLGEWLALSVLFAQEVKRVRIPDSFFENNEFAMQFEVDGSEGRFRADFEAITTRYLIIRFKPAPGSSEGLKIFEIGLFGDVPEERRRLVRIPVFEFFEDASNTTDGDGNPTAGTSDGGNGGFIDGGSPRPPPAVSPL